MKNNYSEIIENYFKVEFTGKYTLDNILKATKILWNPQRSFKIIHVAWTNWKWSVSKMLFSILKNASKKVWVFTSPHLLDIKERFQTNSWLISDSTFVKIVEKIIELDIELSYFDKCVLVAFEYFKIEKCEYVILEVWLWGLHDTTNIIIPLITTITSISLDHQNILWDTLEKISFQKAGIIKKNIPIVLNFRNKVIEEKAKEKESEIIFSKKWYNTNLKWKFQKENAGLSYQIAKYIWIDKIIILSWLMQVEHKWRLDFIRHNLLIDWAHNLDSLIQLKNYIDSNLINKFDTIYYCFSIKRGKEVSLFLDVLWKDKNYIIVETNNIMLEKNENIEKSLNNYWINSTLLNPLDIIKKSEKEEKALYVVFWSLYMIWEFYK